jgi:co-chaperonin GroES (HSP10)
MRQTGADGTVKEGDRMLFSKYAGNRNQRSTASSILFMREDDILGVILQ